MPEPRPVLYLMVGYPGSGKTTISKIIHEATGAVHLWADHERHRMFAQPTHSFAESIELYEHLNQSTEHLLKEGKSVIFDTNFNYHRDRQHLSRIALKHGAKVVIIWVTTPKEIAKQRAIHDSEGQDTRLFGNMTAEDFERLSGHLEHPTAEELAVKIDGSSLSPASVKQLLGL